MNEKMVRVKRAKHVEGFVIEFTFTDGSKRQINLEPYLSGPLFEPLRADVSSFRNFRIEFGSIAWPNGAGIDPDVLYLNLTPAAWETPAR